MFKPVVGCVLRLTCFVVLAAATLTAAGCGSKPVVTGTVTYKSALLTSGEVSFVSDSGGSRSGLITADGKYEIQDPPTGEVTVVVVSTKIAKKDGPRGGLTGGVGSKFEDLKSEVVKSVIPTKYNDPKSSPLRYTVVSGKQTKDIVLDD